MANQKDMNKIRNEAVELFLNGAFDGFAVVGQVVEGVVFKHVALDAFVVFKPIVKKEGFDVEDALAEFAEKQEARAEKEAEKVRKEAEREAKAAAKAKEGK